uniref:Phosphoesterase n=1 Tax=Coralloluteibacterium stylophorae TaxID=1776034 RepID=A0A8J8AYI8_9GAMM
MIADTHGLLRPQALEFLQGSDAILHAGDIGDASILERLTALAPLTVVRGNNDTAAWAASIPETVELDFAGVAVHMLHDLKTLACDPGARGVRVVVAGHSHKPGCHERDGVLFVNPGSAGPRRFRLPVSVGELRIAEGTVEVRLQELAVG